MKTPTYACAAAVLLLAFRLTGTAQTVYPTGTTIYDPDRAWSGYTVLFVWEYLYPQFGGANASNAVYRAYRMPYGWIPQLTAPKEQRVTPPAQGDFRVP